MGIIKKYSGFINENMDQAKSIISKKMAAFDKLKVLLSKNLGYIGKFTEYLMDENVAYEDLEELYKKITELKSRNTTIDISKLSYEKSLDKIISVNNDLSVNGLISKFPSEQKKIAKNLILNNKTNYNIFLKVSNKEDLQTFLSKVSRYKDSDSLLSAMKVFSKDPKNSKEQVKELINDIKSDIVFENDNILVIKVDSLSDINVLGSDTSWCILGSGQWTNYTKNRLQYILYDYTKDEFDPTFKIGFTLEKSGAIYAAHNILDGSASNELRRVLEENSLTTIKLLPEVKKVDMSEIDNINSRTTTESLKLLIENLTIENKKEISKLIVKLFDVFGYRRATKNGLVNRALNSAKVVILKSLINKYFYGSKLITEEDCNKVDSRLMKYMLEHELWTQSMVNPNIFRSSLSTDAIDAGLDIWSDQILVDFATNLYISNFLASSSANYNYIDFTKPIPNERFTKTKEVTTKLSDRFNKIYNENTVNFNSDSHRNRFNYRVLFLNYILGRPDSCPDKDKLLKLVPVEDKINYPGLFSKSIDLSEGIIRLGQFNKYFPVDLVEKKDYPETKVYFDNHGLLNIIPNLIKHLDGYELMLNITRENLKYILTSGASYESKLEEYSKKVFDLLKKFPKRVYKDSYVTEGKLKIVVRN
jgi:hypothetical protein